MHPALSVILFTTLSGAGLGLWAWLGLRLALGTPPQGLQPLGWILLLCAAGVAVAGGLLASFWHLGKPLRAWRAFSQWRTSWLSREGVLATACFAPAAALLVLLGRGEAASNIAPAVRIAGALLALLSLATVACTAMIYASLKPIPAWRHPLVVPVYLVFALLTGGLPLLLALEGRPTGLEGALPRLLLTLAALALVLKLAYWRAIDRNPLPLARGDAIGLPGRSATVFERPHTEANFVTREMAFVLARRHARLLRLAAVLLFALVPIACLLVPDARLAGWAAASALAGAFAERWLFFAQARHLVTLYY